MSRTNPRNVPYSPAMSRGYRQARGSSVALLLARPWRVRQQSLRRVGPRLNGRRARLVDRLDRFGCRGRADLLGADHRVHAARVATGRTRADHRGTQWLAGEPLAAHLPARIAV